MHTEDAIKVIEEIIKNKDKFNLLLEIRHRSNSKKEYNMSAHKIWAVGFKENEKVRTNVKKIAVVGVDSSKFRAEKEYMESENLKFLIKLEEAIIWIESIS